MELKKPLPPGRSREQIENHYLVEKSIARRLMAANREEREVIYATMYDELFSKVPDHPRLQRRASKQLTDNRNALKLALVSRFLDADSVFVEFAPGDCQFTTLIARNVARAIGVDISDQRSKELECPDNFELMIYDGYDLNDIMDNSIDISFSDQLVEHFHPEDLESHFELSFRILRNGGKYVFRTPHVLTGPHDISQFFSDEPECFHLKEWTFVELTELLSRVGYSRVDCYWFKKGMSIRLPFVYFSVIEGILKRIPKTKARVLARYLVPEILVVASK